MHDFAVLRQRMVDNQIRTSAVTDTAVIKAFLTVPRELFVDPAERPFAYADRDVLMSAGAPDRRMMQPVQLARLVQALPIETGSSVLVVGCGTGYSAAIISMLGARVVGVEEDRELARLAAETLGAIDATGVRIALGKLVAGFAEEAPYDAILIDGAVEFVPDALIAQLRPGGALATVEQGNRISRAMLYERAGREATKWPQFEAWTALLPGFSKAPEFTF
jgi:protein-L-isoaspartate(D-aspartate) O-methyltransferase